MKILGVGSHVLYDTNKQSQVDWWRIGRPLDELKKHTDWQIDQQVTYIAGFEKYNSLEEFTQTELEKALEKLGEYDVVFSSYHADIAAYLLLKIARDRYGTQFILDVDDDMFAINEDNPYWAKMDDEKTWRMQVMIRENAWLCTTTEALAERFRVRRKMPPDNHADDSLFVIPNFIPDAYKELDVDNDEDIVIGYFGGSSHAKDLSDTGAIEAVQKIMHENKRVRFHAIGMPIDSYLPRGRYSFTQGKRGTKWLTELFPTLNLDIAIAPLADNVFNRGKSNIKWQEATRAGAVVVATDLEPYKNIPSNCITRIKNNSEDWYYFLKQLVEDKALRQKQLTNARKQLKLHRLETNWRAYKSMFETVKGAAHANNQTRSKTVVL